MGKLFNVSYIVGNMIGCIFVCFDIDFDNVVVL